MGAVGRKHAEVASQRGRCLHLIWLERRGKVLGEKNLRGNNNRQRHDNHHSKRQCDKPYPAAPPKPANPSFLHSGFVIDSSLGFSSFTGFVSIRVISDCKTLALQTGSSEAEIPPHFYGKTSNRVCTRGVRARSCHKMSSRRSSLPCSSSI